MSKELFEKLYGQLNPAQKKAVDTIEGPVMVVAGPGTGKTQVLTIRIANIIKTGSASPDEILAITFTEAGAHTMRRRLLDIIGSAASRVNIHTFHGFCNRIILEFPASFPHIVGSSAATEGDEIALLQQVIDEGEFLHLRPRGNPHHYLTAIKACIGSLKREGVRPEEYRKAAKSATKDAKRHVLAAKELSRKEQTEAERKLSKAEKNIDIAASYAAYEALKRANRLYDYSDMIMEVGEAMANDLALRQELQERYHYILVDEHQDTNDAQNVILDHLTRDVERPNLFVVGDDMQAIYRFQGASVKNFLHLKRKYPEAVGIAISENYRSHQTILSFAQTLVMENEVKRTRLVSAGGNAAHPIRIVAVKDPDEEKAWVVRELSILRKEGIPAEEIALLYRTNDEGAMWAGELERAGIPVSLESATELFSDHSILRAKRILKAAEDPNNNTAMFAYLLQDIAGCDPLDIFLAWGLAQTSRKALWEVVRSVGDGSEMTNAEALQRAMHALRAVIRAFESEGAQAGLQAAMRETGLLASVLSRPDALNAAERFSFLFDEAAEVDARGATDQPLLAFMKRLNILEEHQTRRGGARASRPGRVRLMTAHGSKGQEFDTVFIVNSKEGNWSGKRVNPMNIKLLALEGHPGLADTEEADRVEDEKRLFYVAATRAKNRLIAVYPEKNEDGNEQSRTQFLSDLPSELVSEEKGVLEERELLAYVARRLGGGEKSTRTLRDAAYIAELLDARGISPTHLNSFLSCKWKYFFVNLLRVPQPVEPYLQYGTAVHAALQRLFEGDPRITKTAFLDAYEKKLEQAAITGSRKKDYMEHGREVLEKYYEWARTAPFWARPVFCEVKLEAVLSDGTKINGKLDKVELLESGSAAIIDYKTGSPKTLNAIMGKTKDENAPGIYRQVAFYRLLCDRQKKPRWRFSTGRVEFVESIAEGRMIFHDLPVTSQEAEKIEQQVLEMAREVRELSFWNWRCEDAKCEYCALREMMERK